MLDKVLESCILTPAFSGPDGSLLLLAAMTTVRSCPFVIQTTITKAPKTQQGAEKHLSKVQQGAVQHSSTVPDGFVQLTDRDGNITDALTPAGSLPPVGWYPGDDDYVHKEFPQGKGAAQHAAEDRAAKGLRRGDGLHTGWRHHQ